MNGLSFSDFESASFDALQARGFGGSFPNEVRVQKMLSQGALAQQRGLEPLPAQRRQPQAPPASQNPPVRQSIGALPGSDNSRLDATWRPSAEAHLNAKHSPTPPATTNPAPAPNGGQKGAFVGWKSN
mmetsp:Transcript_39339/g.83829  ORF Transcript_39339/g.83829 Transcript_39339/m.83829 type:complete len:128 (+) Transcript_39339:418-801(+)|eukprot:CAMPEP_0206568024 /NCGR_PEP_ID=MMETSP0325_2-20121206/25602_1 /ASSEMBLY_ACC=CAM_ASM_000347 /TAXON_ID=2866 /ORGANISM="Crypthecodinium cohnii, Strain Seligo" /LENGTH=127 /DNA_ID=CAMNT_0054071355 /DNA_START=353 /DNA_END=736 /DNA_ORIENTATION=-